MTMHPVLIPIYGPIAVQAYGVCIVFALLIFLGALAKDKQINTLISHNILMDAVILGIISAIIGGRIFFVLHNYHDFNCWYDYIALWHGGFSVLGSLIGILLTIPPFFMYHNIPVAPLLDRIAIYAPLLQGLSRFGCFFAGCCYGSATNLPWGMLIDEWESLVHPAPLYSAINLLLIFCFLYGVAQQRINKQGQLLALYIFLVTLERFFVDFWRGDRQYFAITYGNFFSINQWVALCLSAVAVYLYYRFSKQVQAE